MNDTNETEKTAKNLNDNKNTPESSSDISELLLHEIYENCIIVNKNSKIDVRYPINIDPIGCKNTNHDLRGDEAYPKFVVSPWLQTDTNIKPC